MTELYSRKPIAMDDEWDVDIMDMAYGGDGVGKLPDGRVVFVPFVARGERVRVRITEVKRRFARGELVEILQPSPERVQPRCAVYGRCAGCQFQHLGYDEQCTLKEQQVRTLLQRIGGFQDPPVASIIPSPQPWNYRSRITLHGPGAPAYVARDGCTRVPIADCPIARTELNDALISWMDEHPDGLAEQEDLALRLDGEGRAWATKGQDLREVQHPVCGREFAVPLNSFCQVNQWVSDAMADHVVACVREYHPDILIDAYAGVGVFGLLSAGGIRKVYAIESDRFAVAAGLRNASRFGAENIEFVNAPTESALPELLRTISNDRVMCILDPPRMGCPASVLDVLIAAGIPVLLYISCAPDRLARDACKLCGSGYHLERVTPFDMFPQTRHIEVVATFIHTANLDEY